MEFKINYWKLCLAIAGGILIATAVTAITIQTWAYYQLEQLESAGNAARQRTEQVAVKRANEARSKTEDQRKKDQTGRQLNTQCRQWQKAVKDFGTSSAKENARSYCRAYDVYIQTGKRIRTPLE